MHMVSRSLTLPWLPWQVAVVLVHTSKILPAYLGRFFLRTSEQRRGDDGSEHIFPRLSIPTTFARVCPTKIRSSYRHAYQIPSTTLCNFDRLNSKIPSNVLLKDFTGIALPFR